MLDHAPDIPDGLGACVQRVHHVAREDAVSTDRTDAARAVDREYGQEQVQAEFVVQVIRPE
jgi:hypothetical protein